MSIQLDKRGAEALREESITACDTTEVKVRGILENSLSKAGLTTRFVGESEAWPGAGEKEIQVRAYLTQAGNFRAVLKADKSTPEGKALGGLVKVAIAALESAGYEVESDKLRMQGGHRGGDNSTEYLLRILPRAA